VTGMLADWDPRLITPARALELAGDWPLIATAERAQLSQFEPEGGGPRQPDRWQINLRCAKDDRSVFMLGDDTPGPPMQSTIGDLLSGVLRHLVMAHDVSLSAAEGEPR
jgi:hypothetical protein